MGKGKRMGGGVKGRRGKNGFREGGRIFGVGEVVGGVKGGRRGFGGVG